MLMSLYVEADADGTAGWVCMYVITQNRSQNAQRIVHMERRLIVDNQGAIAVVSCCSLRGYIHTLKSVRQQWYLRTTGRR